MYPPIASRGHAVKGRLDPFLTPFVKDKEEKLFVDNKDRSITWKRESSKIDNSTIPKDGFYTINNNPKEVFNNSKNYQLINVIIKSGIDELINFNNAKHIYSEIEKNSSGGLKSLLNDF